MYANDPYAADTTADPAVPAEPKAESALTKVNTVLTVLLGFGLSATAGFWLLEHRESIAVAFRRDERDDRSRVTAVVARLMSSKTWASKDLPERDETLEEVMRDARIDWDHLVPDFSAFPVDQKTARRR